MQEESFELLLLVTATGRHEEQSSCTGQTTLVFENVNFVNGEVFLVYL